MAEKRADKRPETGWGELLQQFFDPSKVRVENHAQNGRSTKTFIAEGRWQALVEKLKPGDYVFIQFGHNDQPKEKASHTPPADYRANLVRFVDEVRAKKATPVLFTPVVRRRFDDKGEFYDTHFEYPDIVRAVAAEQKVALIDMHRKSERSCEQLRRRGVEKALPSTQARRAPQLPEGRRRQHALLPARRRRDGPPRRRRRPRTQARFSKAPEKEDRRQESGDRS